MRTFLGLLALLVLTAAPGARLLCAWSCADADTAPAAHAHHCEEPVSASGQLERVDSCRDHPDDTVADLVASTGLADIPVDSATAVSDASLPGEIAALSLIQGGPPPLHARQVLRI